MNELEKLAHAWQIAKQEEEAAVARRRAIGQAIEALLPGADEGTATQKVGSLKVCVLRKLTRKVDSAALQGAWSSLDTEVQDAFRWSAEVNVKHLRALDELKSPAVLTIAQFVTSKPAAASVSVEAIKAE